MSLLTLRSVVAGIGGTRIVGDVSFEVADGSFVALVGPNGCGKSTLLRTIAGVLPKMGGQILLRDVDTARMRPGERARLLALVGQNDSPGDAQSVEEVVSLGRVAHRSPWALGGRGDRDAIARALAQVGLTGFERRAFEKLSGGEQRRVLIARGLAQDTPLLLLDEPTNHLDVGQQYSLLSGVHAAGLTVLAALHDLNLAMSYADRVVVLHDGRLRACGPTDEVLTADLIHEVFDVVADPAVNPTTGARQWLFSEEPGARVPN